MGGFVGGVEVVLRREWEGGVGGMKMDERGVEIALKRVRKLCENSCKIGGTLRCSGSGGSHLVRFIWTLQPY